MTIQNLEAKLKQQLTPGIVQSIEKLCDELKLIDAQQIAQEVAYGKQRVFAYWNKPGKQLAKALSEKKRNINRISVEAQKEKDEIYNTN